MPGRAARPPGKRPRPERQPPHHPRERPARPAARRSVGDSVLERACCLPYSNHRQSWRLNMSRSLAPKLLCLLLLAISAAPAAAQPGSDFDTLLVQIQVLEKYHTRAEVVGMLFRIYEP